MEIITDERDSVELVDDLRNHLAACPNDQRAREEILRLAGEIDRPPQARPVTLETWDGAVPLAPSRWLVDGWLPAGRVTMLAGPGGIGKSRLALQLAAGIASGTGSWIETPSPGMLKLGDAVEVGGSPIVYATWEDEPEEVWRRLSQLSGSAAPWATPQRLRCLHVADMFGHGPLWAPKSDWKGHTDTLGATTSAGHELRQHCEREGAKLLVVDPLAAAHGCNENIRELVRAFVSELDFWARGNDCGVLILSHPPKGGASYSASTDWEASVRSMWTLWKEKSKPDPPTEGWQLARPKAYYGAAVGPLQLDWDATGGGLRWKVTGKWPDGGTRQAPKAPNGSGRYGSL